MDVNPDQSKIRVACFVDGFNLYHAIDEMDREELKWVNLWKLMESFIDPTIHQIVGVYISLPLPSGSPAPMYVINPML